MEYDRSDSFTLDFELNGTAFGSKSEGKLSEGQFFCERNEVTDCIQLSKRCEIRGRIFFSRIDYITRGNKLHLHIIRG